MSSAVRTKQNAADIQIRAARHAEITEIIRPLMGDAGTLKSFGLVQQGGASVKVMAGAIHVLGDETLHCDTDTVSLSGDPCWVLIQYDRSAGNPAVATSNAEPTSTSPWVRLPLAKFTMVAENLYEIKPGDLKHDGDFFFDVPLRRGSQIL